MPLPEITVTGRLDRLRAAFGDHEIDALVVTTLPNVRYLTGFSGSAAVLVVTEDLAVLTTDGRYRTQSAEQLQRAGAGDVEITIGAGAEQRQAALAALDAANAGRIGLEAGNVTWSGQRSWADLLGGDRLVPTANAVEALRERKDAAEIARMERAAAIADAALFEVLPLHEPGRQRGALRPGARYGHAPRRGREHRLRDDRRRRRELGQAAPPPRARGASTGETPSSSTSAPRSRATAPT